MHRTFFLYLIFVTIYQVFANSYSVNIGTDKHVNLIDKRFLSFTIDPKYLFSNNGKYKSKECICMASSLTPAFIRIAGPSTALMSYHNTSIAIEEPGSRAKGRRSQFQSLFSDNLAQIDQALRRHEKGGRDGREEGRFKRNPNRLEVSHSEWRGFVRWAKSTGFDLVFAVNNHDKMPAGIWDPNMALNILTVAEKAEIGEIYWQLGYECTNQSIEEYLNDLETLRVIVETFPAGLRGEWRLAGGDVTRCLQAGSSDFKDYVTLASDLMDAILLNGNSSSDELSRLSERDRMKLLRLLSENTTPLWLTEQPWSDVAETSRAADWLTSLGHAARNGFSVHYRELDEEELYQPTLSFYMALLFKNLVGEKVLNVEMQPDQAIMFAHCTTLRHKEVPGAVTLYGVNLDAEPARFSVKLGRRAEGGDVMQFILGRDRSGNIIVNGKPMYHEGDLKPVVKRVRPYKTLVVNLPAQSFGFWVLANTKVDACFDEKLNETENIDDAVPFSLEQEDLKTKRSIIVNDFEEYSSEGDSLVDFYDENDVSEKHTDEDLKDGIENIHKDLGTVGLLGDKSKEMLRAKRQAREEKPINKIRQFIRKNIKNKNPNPEEEKNPKGLLGFLKKTRYNITRHVKRHKINLEKSVFNKNKLIKRQSDGKRKTNNKWRSVRNENFDIKNIRYQTLPLKKLNNNFNVMNSLVKTKVIDRKKPNQGIGDETKLINSDKTLTHIEKENDVKKERTRRSTKDQVEFSAENEIDNNSDVIDDAKLWKLLQRIHKQIKDISDENDEYGDDVVNTEDNSKFTRSRNTKQYTSEDMNLDDSNNNNKSDDTFLKSTLFSLLRVISDLNNNLNKFWNGIRLVD